MKINWRVRILNKQFWVAMIPAILLLIQAGAAVFGWTMDLGELGSRLLTFADAVFVVLVLLGVVNDPTTAGYSDSFRARHYEAPWED